MRYVFDEYRNVSCPSDLLPSDVAGLERCIGSAFSGGITRDDAYHHMAGDQIIIIRDTNELNEDTAIVGFSSTLIASPRELFSYEDASSVRAGYFAGAAIDSAYQGSGLYSELFSLRYEFTRESGVDEIFTRTQNPAVLKGMSRGVERLVMSGDIKAYSFGQRVCSRAYYGKLNPSMKQHFSYIDTEAGDAVLFSWKFECR